MKNRAYLIAVLSGTLAVLVVPGAGAQVTPDPVLRPGAVQDDPALTPFQTNPQSVQRPGAVQDDPALRPDQTNPAPVVAPTPGDTLAPLPPIFKD
ncbi:MAG TPA: hypothetical protein VLC47_11670 [Burkholderiales bacterium]|nr:hypothetical protein [Burkholderiales bacterium]